MHGVNIWFASFYSYLSFFTFTLLPWTISYQTMTLTIRKSAHDEIAYLEFTSWAWKKMEFLEFSSVFAFNSQCAILLFLVCIVSVVDIGYMFVYICYEMFILLLYVHRKHKVLIT